MSDDGEKRTPEIEPDGRPRVDPRLLEILVCPVTRAELTYDPVRQELADPSAGEAIHDSLRHDVQVGAWVDPMRDAGADDGQDHRRPLAAEIAVGEEPVLPAEHERSELALEPIVG